MIYALIRTPFLALLRAPAEPPEAPGGSHSSTQVFRASPRFLSYRLLLLRLLTAFLALVCLIVLIAAVVSGEPEPAIAVGVLGLVIFPILLLAGLFLRVDYDLRYYVVTDRSLRVREGAWNVREMTITYANVQNMRLVQGPLMRLFGFKHLQVDVAGGGVVKAEHGSQGGHHVRVAGVENATELRDLILTYQREVRPGAGLGDPEDDAVNSVAPRGLSARALAALEAVAGAAAGLSAAARRLPAAGD